MGSDKVGSMSAGAISQDDLRELVATLHSELHHLARHQRRQLGGAETLQTTALVNEVYLKLFRKGRWQDRAHFLNAAAMAMRQVLVDYARKRLAQKRDFSAADVPVEALDDEAPESVLSESDERIVALEDALLELETNEPRLARVVECRYFAGYTEQETAVALGVNERTVRRDWNKARELLYRSLFGAG
jgi:RNA polymerase sigma factor (TIGR02999 family)